MTLEEVFEHRQFVEHRELQLSEEDIEYLIQKLKDGDTIDEVLPFLTVVDSLPAKLLKPIMEKAIEYKDVSAPKRWMHLMSRLFTAEKVQEALLAIILNADGFKEKCKAVGILYCVGTGAALQRDKNSDEHIWTGEFIPVWNGERYERQLVAKAPEKVKRRLEDLRKRRLSVLLSEFLENDNVIYRFYIRRYLLDRLADYPRELSDQAKRVHQILSLKDFPKGVQQVKMLEDAIDGVGFP